MNIFKKIVQSFKAPQPSRPDLRQVAATSLQDRWSTYPSNGLTPSSLAVILREADQGSLWRQAELFEEMEEKDCHLAAVLQTRRLAVAGLNWNVQAYSDDARDQEIAAFCDEQLRQIGDYEMAMQDLLDAIGKGYSACEIIWKVSGRQALVERLEWIHPKRLTWWDSLTPRLLTETDMVRGIEPPPWKLVVHRYRARSGHDTRGGVLRVCAWVYLFKNYAIKDWAVFAEIFGMPLRLGRYEASASQADKDALVLALKSLGSDAAGIISKSTEIQFVEASQRGSSNANPYETLVNFCNREISKAVLGQTLTTDTSGATGTYSAGKVHNEVRRDVLEADAGALANTLRTQLLRPLVGFNFGWDRPVPYLNFNVEEDEDLKAVAETHRMLAEMGCEFSQEYLSDRFGFPLPEPGQEVVGGQGAGGGNSGQGSEASDQGNKKNKGEGEEEQGSDSSPGSESNKGRVTLPLRDGALEITGHDKPVIQAQEDLERLALAAAAASADVVARMLAPVRAFIETGESLETVRDGLLEAYPELAPEELGELVYQASMLAYMKGRERGD